MVYFPAISTLNKVQLIKMTPFQPCYELCNISRPVDFYVVSRIRILKLRFSIFYISLKRETFINLLIIVILSIKKLKNGFKDK